MELLSTVERLNRQERNLSTRNSSTVHPSIEAIITRKSSANELCLSAAIGQATGGPTDRESKREIERRRESVSEVAYASDLWV